MPHDERPLGVIYDVDGVLAIVRPRRLLGRLQAAVVRSPLDRRSPLGMPQLMRMVATVTAPDVPVYYLSAAPSPFTRAVTRFLRRDGYPPGRTVTSKRLATGLTRKHDLLDELAARHPQVRWVLVGDDAGHDPRLFGDFAHRYPDRVAVIALRQAEPGGLRDPLAERVSGVGVVTAPNGAELMPPLRTALRLEPPRAGAIDDWFLTAVERGNDATRLRAWTTGNAVHALIHGRTYFAAVADALVDTGPGDAMLFAGWRADAEELLTDRGPTVADALTGAARRGVLVRGLLWRSHLSAFGYHLRQNRTLATAVADDGVEVLLDQRIRALGSHHQKLIVIRRAGRESDDVAFVGGIDLDRGSRDHGGHQGDPQPESSDGVYGTTPARHDVQIQLHGPAVREVEDTFRERWEDPAPLVRLPWHVIGDRIHSLARQGSPLPPPAPDPPAAGSCAVQILRTYPRRRPAHPFAPWGERSVARAYTKVLSRARRLIYLEDQYLWSVDVARIFAAALRQSPQLQLIAVVPRRIDQQVATRAAELGQAEAMAMVRAAGRDRVQIFDIENDDGRPIYVHAKVCIVDDVWAAVGSNNLNNRSWTHDSELTAAILDDDRDSRAPTDPAGLGDDARRFARQLRLDLMREHLGRPPGDDTGLLDPDRAAETVRRHAAALDAWHADGRHGPRPPGRLRGHGLGSLGRLPRRHRWFTVPAYRRVLDPDGRPLTMRLRRAY